MCSFIVVTWRSCQYSQRYIKIRTDNSKIDTQCIMSCKPKRVYTLYGTAEATREQRTQNKKNNAILCHTLP